MENGRVHFGVPVPAGLARGDTGSRPRDVPFAKPPLSFNCIRERSGSLHSLRDLSNLFWSLFTCERGPARPCAVLAASRGAESDGGSLASRALLSSPLLSRGRGRAGDRQAFSLAAGAFPSAHVGPWAAAHALC